MLAILKEREVAGASGGRPAGGPAEAAGASEGGGAAGLGQGGAQPGPPGLGECGALWGELEAPGATRGQYEGAGGEVGPGV